MPQEVLMFFIPQISKAEDFSQCTTTSNFQEEKEPHGREQPWEIQSRSQVLNKKHTRSPCKRSSVTFNFLAKEF